MFREIFFAVLTAMDLAVLLAMLARLPWAKALAAKRGVRLHLIGARASLMLMALLIVMVEGRALLHGHIHVDWLARAHLLLAVPCAVGMALLNFRLNGRNTPSHARYAWVTAALLAGVNLTGIPMALAKF